MKEAQKSGFSFSGYKILNSQIYTQHIEDFSTDLNISFNPSGKLNMQSKKFELTVETSINNADNSLTVNVLIVGFFEYSIDSDDSKLETYFYTNAPAIIFPYIRAYISALTALSGYTPIHLPTINFSSIGETLKKNTTIS